MIPLSPVVVLFVRLVVAVLGAVRAEQLRISSWGRTPERNAEVGGAPNSKHLSWLAMDLVGPADELGRVAALWTAIGLDAVQESDHLHIELDGPLLRS